MPYRRSFSQGAAIFALAALGPAGCGGDDEVADGLARAVPASSPVYLELATDEPEAYDTLRVLAGDTRVASDLESFAQRLVGTGPGDVDFATEIEPWLGERAGVFLVTPGAEPIGGVVAEVTDDAEAEAFAQAALADQGTLSEAEYRDIGYLEGEEALVAVHDGVILAASSPEALELSVDALLDGGLAADAGFEEAGGAVAADDALVGVHLDLAALGASLDGVSPGASEAFDAFAAGLGVETADPVALALSGEEREVTVRGAFSATDPAPFEPIPAPPRNAWLALSADGAGSRLPALLEGLALAGGGSPEAVDAAFQGVDGLSVTGLELLGVEDRLSIAAETPSAQAALDLGRFAAAVLRARGYEDVVGEDGSAEALELGTGQPITFSVRQTSLLVGVGGRGDETLAEADDTGESESGLIALGLARGEGLAAFLEEIRRPRLALALEPVAEIAFAATNGNDPALRELRITLR